MGAHIGEKIEVFVGNCLAHGGRDKVAGEGGRHKKNQGKSNGEKGEIVSETGVEEGEKIQKKNSADGEEKGIGQRQGDGELGERRAEKFAFSAAEKKKKTEGKKGDERFGPSKFFLEGVVKAGCH